MFLKYKISPFFDFFKKAKGFAVPKMATKGSLRFTPFLDAFMADRSGVEYFQYSMVEHKKNLLYHNLTFLSVKES
jgi:hypothetical protein